MFSCFDRKIFFIHCYQVIIIHTSIRCVYDVVVCLLRLVKYQMILFDHYVQCMRYHNHYGHNTCIPPPNLTWGLVYPSQSLLHEWAEILEVNNLYRVHNLHLFLKYSEHYFYIILGHLGILFYWRWIQSFCSNYEYKLSFQNHRMSGLLTFPGDTRFINLHRTLNLLLCPNQRTMSGLKVTY